MAVLMFMQNSLMKREHGLQYGRLVPTLMKLEIILAIRMEVSAGQTVAK